MNSQIEISELQAMTSGIRDELTQLLIDVVQDGASVGFLAPLDGKEAAEYWQEVIQPGVILWTAAADKKIIGTIQLQLAMKPNGSHRAEIAKLMVHPIHRRLGLARRLMQAAEDKAKILGRSLLVLDTRAGDPSNNLYRALGYMEAGRIPNYAKSSNGNLDDTVFYYKMV